jgi:hypothetical protein
MKTMIAVAILCAGCYGQSVTIVNSGSTNTDGFQIVVARSGKAEYTSQPRRIDSGKAPKAITRKISKSLAGRLYEDVAAARPLASLPPRHCMKSASFGTRLTIRVDDDESPDLSCGDGGDPKLQALARDADAIVQACRPEDSVKK